MITLYFLFNLAGCGMLHLSHRNQRWLAQALAPRWRTSGALLLVLSLICAFNAYAPLTAVFAWLVLQMLVFGLLPFGALLKAGHER